MQDKNPSPESHFEFKQIPKSMWIYILDVLDLKKGVNQGRTILEIKKMSSMGGANAWMLMCSIVIASIGLSQNSQAVIIGAMLISPLMSPILGVGLSVGINDMETLKSSLKHFSVAIIIALLTSMVYFYLTPFDNLTDEIRSRTSPTFLDILVALFGGIAGIISVARKDLSTTLPGVAIATALMPPLCVTGFGIANANWEIASKSFYLFFLNTFFVALATYIIVRLLKFPFKSYVNARTRHLNHLFMGLFTLALIVPSFLIFQHVLRDARLEVNMNRFATECLQEKTKYLDSYQTKRLNDGSIMIFLKVYGDVIDAADIDSYQDCLYRLGVENVSIEILSTSEVNIEQVDDINKGLKDIKARLEAVQLDRQSKAQLLQYYQSALIDTAAFDAIRDEINVLFPDLVQIGLSNMHTSDFINTRHGQPVLFLRWDDTTSIEHKNQASGKLSAFVRQRLDLDTLQVVVQ